MASNQNLIRFDWAMKRLLRNKANFSVLEGFLSELFQEDIKIHKILDSESNKENSEDKYNRVDLLTENEKGELIIIEVQNQNELDYFHRMAYGTSKIVTEYLDEGQAYEKLKKVYSINIVYFDLGQGKDYIYKGTTDFLGLHYKDKLLLSDKQQFKYKKIEPNKIFPEYYLLKVNQFDNKAKNTLDEWIYYFKNNEIRDEFKAKGLDKVKKILKYDKLTEKDKKEYNRHIENLRYKASMLSTLKTEEEYKVHEKGKEEGEKIGIKKGEKIKGYRVALESLRNGLDKELVSTITRIPNETIEKLKNMLEKYDDKAEEHFDEI